ncbi:hypothetical protein ElyMa_002805300 [Elysia marginata]|uniref:Uncharacterized protein n=1 Tax=Elysia marginata TaxID=1093978 RepID=A0AAV4HT97_9GAST|nr:hypothetical protein ElyMa_002805300 [Elysia marginata]
MPGRAPCQNCKGGLKRLQQQRWAEATSIAKLITLIIVEQPAHNTQLPRSNCDTDHFLVASKEFLLQCWEGGIVPEDMRDDNIITLHNNKSKRSGCNNYRGISLLFITDKTLARIVLKKWQVLAERVYPLAKFEFIEENCTGGLIFSP